MTLALAMNTVNLNVRTVDTNIQNRKSALRIETPVSFALNGTISQEIYVAAKRSVIHTVQNILYTALLTISLICLMIVSGLYKMLANLT